MRVIRPNTSATIVLWAFALAPAGLAQANDLKPAMARIRDLNNQGGGSGFIFRHDEKDNVAYLLTNEHVVRGREKVNVQFFSADNSAPIKSVIGTVIRQDKAKDLAIVKVSGGGDVPPDVMVLAFGHASALMPGDSVELLTYSSEDGEWSVLKGTIEALRPEVVGPEGSEAVHAIRFSGFIRDGDSGAPLIMGDQVFGVVESAPVPSSNPESPRAIQIATIQEFLKELLPEPDPHPFWWHAKQTAAPHPPLDRDAKACATSFLDLLVHDEIRKAYGLVSDATKSSVSEDSFMSTYQSFAMRAKGGLIDRRLGDSQAFSYPPSAPQIVAPTFIIIFESTYQPDTTIRVYETVTVIKENRNWRVLDFVWNPQPSGTSER
jgi:hypothetical protein